MKVIIKQNDKDIEYNSKNIPIMIILSPNDRKKISNCPSGSVIYSVYPEGADHQKMMEWTESKK